MYRDLWRLHVSAVIGFFCALGLAGDASSQGDALGATLWFLGSLVCVGILVAPMWLMRFGKRRSGPPGRHGSGKVKY